MPSHFIHAEWKAGNTVEKANLALLIGHAWVVQVPAGSNITGASGVDSGGGSGVGRTSCNEGLGSGGFRAKVR
jgi:hypothetical protein